MNSSRRQLNFVNQKNSGACVNRNRAIFSARGEFITGLDDDFFLKNRVSAFLNAWNQRKPNTIALFTDAIFIKAKGKKVLSKRRKLVKKVDLFERNHIGNQVFLPTETLREIGGFDESLPSWQDYDCWLRLLANPESTMELISFPTYVTDISHDGKRIGMSSREKKIKAFLIITRKLELTKQELDSMKVVLFDSAQIAPSVSLILSKIMLKPNFSNTMLALKVLLKSVIHNWPSEREVINAAKAGLYEI